MVAMIIGVLIGGVITLVVSDIYYRKSAQSLRFEARAGHFKQEVLELLVAYNEWGQDLRPGQAIMLGAEDGPGASTLYFKHVRQMLRDAGLANAGIRAFCVPSGTVGASLPSYQTIILTEEAGELAEYLERTRHPRSRVVAVMRTDPEERHLVETIWTCIPGEKPGPIQIPRNPSGDTGEDQAKCGHSSSENERSL